MVRAADKVKERTHEGLVIDPEQVSVVKKTGLTILESELIDGIARYREPTSGTMPRMYAVPGSRSSARSSRSTRR